MLRRSSSPYAGTLAVVTTRHDKLELVAPPLWSAVGMGVVLSAADTDALGTFSGEVPRVGGQLETAVRKARLGMAATGLHLGIASEGSIVDPSGFGLGAVDRELVVLVDDHRGIVVAGRASSTDVIAVAATVAPDQPIDDLLRRAEVPPHHLVVSPLGVSPTMSTPATVPAAAPVAGEPQPRWWAGTTKAVADRAGLAAAIERAAACSPQGRARVETDLRAHLCPSRRPVIAAAARDLATRLATRCPTCASPGWGRASVELGRACAWCGGPTDEIAAHRWACPACQASQRRSVAPDTPGDPGRCPRCNP